MQSQSNSFQQMITAWNEGKGKEQNKQAVASTLKYPIKYHITSATTGIKSLTWTPASLATLWTPATTQKAINCWFLYSVVTLWWQMKQH